MSSYIDGVYGAVVNFSSDDSTLGGVFKVLESLGTWADAVAKILGLVK